MQLLNPRLAVSGADDSGGHVCVWTQARPGESPLAVDDVVHTFPGRGAQDVPARETAGELPFTPGDFVGLPQGTLTGPHLYVLPDGPWAAASAPSDDGLTTVSRERPILVEDSELRGPGGPVPLAVVDARSDASLTAYLPAGAILIPTVPLAPGTLYRAQVLMLSPDTGIRRNHTWSFTTGARENAVQVRLQSLRTWPRGGGAVFRASVTTPARRGRLLLQGPGGRAAKRALRPVGRGRLVSKALVLSPGRWRVCAISGGPGTAFRVAQTCLQRRVVTPPRRAPR